MVLRRDAEDTVAGWCVVVLLAAVALQGCGDDGAGRQPSPAAGAVASLTVTSAAFADGGSIPERYTCDGRDDPPPLSWTSGPDTTMQYVVIVEDPDAPGGIFVHWVAGGIPADRTALDEGTTPPIEGVNSFGDRGYGGPCPPPGDDPHRYEFTVYAVDAVPQVGDAADAAAMRGALDGHVVARGTLTGRYGRR